MVRARAANPTEMPNPRQPARKWSRATTAKDVRPGATVLDVGITRTEAGLVGDVALDVRDVAAFVSPVPGGVGPMTRAMLLLNVVEAAEAQTYGAAGG